MLLLQLDGIFNNTHTHEQTVPLLVQAAQFKMDCMADTPHAA